MLRNVNEHIRISTTDLGLCAAIVCKGYKLVDLSKDMNGRATFHLDVKASDYDIETLYWSGELLVSARALAESMKLVKNRLYGGGF